uniref:Uncharacterized protein n=1 Tax=Schistocephalus solidus TaxID=70667 RepID=A0A0X3NXC4_SCHSO
MQFLGWFTSSANDTLTSPSANRKELKIFDADSPSALLVSSLQYDCLRRLWNRISKSKRNGHILFWDVISYESHSHNIKNESFSDSVRSKLLPPALLVNNCFHLRKKNEHT